MEPKSTPTSEELRRLAMLITVLFDKWQLTDAERALLLEPGWENHLPTTEDFKESLNRCAALLSIHKYLRLLFPRNTDMRYQWVKTVNQYWAGQMPLESMCSNGLWGFQKVVQYLERQCYAQT